MSANARLVGHVGSERHHAFNVSVLAVLNVARDSMAAVGFSPATRVLEAAGAGAWLIEATACGAPVIPDVWSGLEDVSTRRARELEALLQEHLQSTGATRQPNWELIAQPRVTADKRSA